MDFFFKYKRLFLILGFILAVFIFGYLIFVLFFQSSIPNSQNTSPVSQNDGKLPTSNTGQGQIIDTNGSTTLPSDASSGQETKIDKIAKGGLTETDLITNTPSLGLTTGKNGDDVQYYNESDGKFYKIDKNGNVETLSDKVFYSVKNVIWSPNKDTAILEYPDGSNIIYNFLTEKQTTLPSHWEDFNFSADGNQIVMKSIGVDPNNRWLATVNSDGTEAKKIEMIGLNADTVYPSWQPNNQSIAMYTKGVDFNRQEVFFVGQNNENFKSTIIEGRGFESIWNPEGDKLIYSVYSSDTNMNPTLWSVNAEGDDIGSQRKNLNIQTWAEKCAFSGNSTLYCAVPDELQKGSGLFPELANNTIDKIYKVDPQTGVKKLVAIPDGNYSVSNIQISDDGQYLYFTDNNTQKIHKITLK